MGSVARHRLARSVRVDITTDTVIARPVAVVAGYAADPSNAPAWYDNIDSVDWESAPEVRVGSRATLVARFLGHRLEYTYELVEVQPAERLVMRTSEGPFPMETTYVWTPILGGGTRMTLRNRGEVRGFSNLLAPLLGPAIRRANRKDLAKLKAILEAR